MSRSLEALVVRVFALLPLVGIVGVFLAPAGKGLFWLLIAAGFLGNAVRGLLLARDTFSVERVGEFLGWFLMLFGLVVAYAACQRLCPSLVRTGPGLSDLAGDYRLEEITLAVQRDGLPDAVALAALEGPPPGARGLLETLVFAMAHARAAGCPEAAAIGAKAGKVLRGESPAEPLFQELAAVVRAGNPACVRAASLLVRELARPALLGAAHMTAEPEGLRVEIETAPSDGSPNRGRLTGLLGHRELEAARAAGIHRARLSQQTGSLWAGILPAGLVVHAVLGPDGRPLQIEASPRAGAPPLFHANLKVCH